MITDPTIAFIEQHPGLFFLDASNLGSLGEMLGRLGVLGKDETVSTAVRAGEGNMNCVLRVKTSRRSLIMKQSRPWVEKYPQFEAPWDRALREADFYTAVARIKPIAKRMPKLLAVDVESRLLVLEDLGAASDFTDWYSGTRVMDTEISEFADFLSTLHHAFLEKPPETPLVNREMRELNARHIFRIPFQEDNGLDLNTVQAGLAEASREIRGNVALREAALRLEKEIYLADGPCLLHGDFFPGSLLRTKTGLRVIDPEFGFMGRAEFDVGICLAHFILSSQAAGHAERFLALYRPVPNHSEELVRQIAGIEIIRRVLGYAQLPLQVSVERKMRWLWIARVWILGE